MPNGRCGSGKMMNGDVYDCNDVMFAWLVLVIVCIVHLSIRRERCRSIRGRRLLRAAGTRALC